MTEAEARAIYDRGREPTVSKLLELAAEVERLNHELHMLKESSQPSEKAKTDEPAKPSGMTPPYEKPSSKGKRRKKRGRKKGHTGARRKKHGCMPGFKKS